MLPMITEILEPKLFSGEEEPNINLASISRQRSILIVLVPTPVNTLVMIPNSFLSNYSPVDNINFFGKPLWSHWGFHVDCFQIGKSFDDKLMWKCHRHIDPKKKYSHRGVTVNNNRLDDAKSRLYSLKKNVYNVQ